MKFKDLSYKKPKGTVENSVKKQGSEDLGKDVQGSSKRVQKAKGDESADTGDG